MSTITTVETCVTTKGIFHHGKKSNKGVVLKQVEQIGMEMCLNDCEQLGGCTYINYNRCKLKCDLMTDYTVGQLNELDLSGDMTFVALNDGIMVGHYNT